MIFKSDGNQENTLFDIKITALSEKEWSINPSESILTYQYTSLFLSLEPLGGSDRDGGH